MPDLTLPRPTPRLALAAAALTLLAACSAPPPPVNDPGWQQRECPHVADANERRRCFDSDAATFQAFRWRIQAARDAAAAH